MNINQIQVIVAFSILIALLSGFYWLVVLREVPSAVDQRPDIVTTPGIFAVRADMPDGWSQAIKESKRQEAGLQENLEFKKDYLAINVNIQLIKKVPSNQVFTGYMPEMREYLSTMEPPVKIGDRDKMQVGRIKTSTGYTIVNLDSLAVKSDKATYIYELPIFVVRDGYETKVVVTYQLPNQSNQVAVDELLNEADKLLLSLRVGYSEQELIFV